jgi:molybdate transport system substrate-binding protein
LKQGIVALAILCGLLPIAVAAQTAPQTFADAKSGDMRVFATGALQASVEAIKAQAEQAAGAPLAIEFGPARGEPRTAILVGTPFDVAILTPEVDAELIKAGKLKAQTYRLAQVQVGMGVRGEGPGDLDISTPEGVKRALLGAKLVRYGPESMGGLTARKVITVLGLQGRIHENTGAGADPDLGPGEYELFINPLSEMGVLKARSVRSLGPIAASLQAPTIIEAAVSTSASNPAAADKLIAFLRGSAMASALAASDLEPLGGR